MRHAIARRPALLRPLAALLGAATTTLPPRPARAATDVVVRVMDADRVKLERAGVVRLAGVRTPTRDVPVCYNREPGVKTRGLLSRGAKVEVELSSGDANIVVGGKSVSDINEALTLISGLVYDGAGAFLFAEYRYIAVFIVGFSLVLLVLLGTINSWEHGAVCNVCVYHARMCTH